MNSFADIARRDAMVTYTTNGAKAINTTGDGCLDLFSTIGALRNADDIRLETLFEEAYKENPLLATKIVFYGRDIREGLGEREVFRKLIRYMAKMHPESLRDNLDLIGVYGRYDDLYAFIGTPLEDDMWVAMKNQFEEDMVNLDEGNAVSLLGKWIKSADASSKSTRELGIMTARKLGYSVYDFKRMVKALRKQIGVVESLMSTGRWDEIKYSAVPSRAMLIYRNAFERHDANRFNEFTNKAVRGEEKINSATLFPYDLVQKVFSRDDDATVEAQWRQLPNYVEAGTNALVMADVSGSMTVWGARPLATSVGLALYFAERNTGAFHNLFMTFSSYPDFVNVKGNTLRQKVHNACNAHWEMNTNLEAAFNKILDMAIENHLSSEDLPKSLIIISDMEIDRATRNDDWCFYDTMKKKYENAGYELPNIVFWNVNSCHDVFHADSKRKGVQLVSGQSATVFKQLMSCIEMTPIECMERTINSERYEKITIEGILKDKTVDDRNMER